MTKMPVQGMQTTYDAYALMTDSASSATAFASGLKTKSGVINMDPETKRSVTRASPSSPTKAAGRSG
jgi:alkaline phosphatase